MGVIREKSPGVDDESTPLCQVREARDEIPPVRVVSEDDAPL
jgi:hypothetical protein